MTPLVTSVMQSPRCARPQGRSRLRRSARRETNRPSALVTTIAASSNAAAGAPARPLPHLSAPGATLGQRSSPDGAMPTSVG